MKHPNQNPHHDRLDLKLTTKQYTAPECGSIDLTTGKPTYCDFDCPTLHGDQPKPEPHWTTNPQRAADYEVERWAAMLGGSPPKTYSTNEDLRQARSIGTVE